MASITLNANVLTPNKIEHTPEKIGVELVMANGRRRFVHRATKETWSLSWEGITSTVRATLRTIFDLTSTFTYIDQFGVSWSVYCPPGGWKCSIAAILPAGATTELRYTVELQIKQV